MLLLLVLYRKLSILLKIQQKNITTGTSDVTWTEEEIIASSESNLLVSSILPVSIKDPTSIGARFLSSKVYFNIGIYVNCPPRVRVYKY